ncbi:MAG: sulfurtransferase [Gammaproteobacteria bacterium]|jgi:thiosulfate/3-mercaptopyruvate sulfurtransferase|nr:sulfurtransferase [Gammaproteobacteria bacterium]MBT3723298.1 sulfurtransferase [Gammaproteobacteria bacterium]MBT4449796.1 sulfurtransferase [Gammaproteobacteria bacterium]MBT4859272.1 sulfurtransferase [Gammaproteobacteria bacterium]MBT6455614.1 sulfurtransferase [Gammaproteobacteria bacterium]
MKLYSPLAGLLLIFSSLSVMADRSFLVDADWLAEHIDDENQVVLEVRYHPHRYYTIGHIPGSVQVQRFKDLGDNQSNPIMRIPSQQAFQDTLRSWGINNDSTVVIYDDSSTALASRVYFLLDLFGFNMNQVKILEGGTIEWTAFEELTKEATPVSQGQVTLKAMDQSKVIEWSNVYDDVVSRRDSSVVLLDARPHDMYTGKIIQHSIMAGHIPGAINIVSLDGTESQKWISEEALTELYAPIEKDKTIYAYCHDGFRMSLAYVQLKSLGYENIRLYNGGWSHWGNRLTLPTVEGDKPYAGDYDL